MGLQRVLKALSLFDHPEDGFASLLVAGTNGKGSVCAYLNSILCSAGIKTGLYTSPHLIHPRERIRAGGRFISPYRWKQLERSVHRIDRRYKLGLTEFEVQTVMAFVYFKEMSVDLAVVEVGLGGRLDATNTLPCPEITVLTSIGHDHMDYLGPTLTDILDEKMAIFRGSVPAVVSVPEEMQPRVSSYCRSHGVPLQLAGRDFKVRHSSASAPGKFHFIRGGKITLKNLSQSLPGRHQMNNASLAIETIFQLRARGWGIPEKSIRTALNSTIWPGRFDIIYPSRGSGPVILDGAHNPEGMQTVVSTYLESPWRRQKATLLFGCLTDKDVRRMIRILTPITARVWTVDLPSARSRPARSLAKLWNTERPAIALDLPDAWALRAATTTREPLLVTGSLYLVGEAYRHLIARRVESPSIAYLHQNS